MSPYQYFSGKKVWITGASTGIGRALALALARHGAKVVVSARRKELLDKLVAAEENIVLAIPFDVTDKASNFAAVEEIKEKLGGLDIPIFNAGGSDKTVKGFSSDDHVECMALNYFSMVYGIEACIPLLKASKYPHIVGMASVAAYGGLPTSTAYSAAKAAAKNMLEGIAVEWHKRVPVSVICPGFVKTPLTDQNDFEMPLIMPAQKAADIIVKGIAKKRREISFPKRLVCLLKTLNMLPKSWYVYLMAEGIKSMKNKTAK